MKRWLQLLFAVASLAVSASLTQTAGAAIGTSCENFSGIIPTPPNDTTCTLWASAIDPEADGIYYIFDFGEGSTNPSDPAIIRRNVRVPSVDVPCAGVQSDTGAVPSGTECSADHRYTTVGNPHTAFAVAYDEANHQSVDSRSVTVFIGAQVLSASLIGTPSDSGWYNNYTSFDYTTSCTASAGFTLNYCRTQVSINLGGWTPINDPAGANGQTNYTYAGSYALTNGVSYRFRSTADDTSTAPVVFSALVPPSGQIQIDQSAPGAWASPPEGNQVAPFVVSATLIDYPFPAPGVSNSGVATWDLQYSTNSGGAWTDCRTTIAAGQTSVNFGSGDSSDCSPTVTLVPNTTYCFQARARDSTNPPPNQGNYYFDADLMCVPYQENAAPYEPSNPSPTDSPLTIASTSTQLLWDGGDPEGGSDTVTYSVYVGTTNPPSSLNGTVEAFGNQTRITYTPAANTFTTGTRYYWQVVARDAASNQISGPVWTFTVNTSPSVTNVSIVPNGATPVNTTATITWNATDPNSLQSLGFSVYYGPTSCNTNPATCLLGATLIASGLTPASAGCSGSPNNYSNCTYTWSSSCAPEISTAQYVAVVASDGLNSGLGSSASTFTINHTETKYYPTSGLFNTANNNETVNFPIAEGSFESCSPIICPPTIEFRGSGGTTTDPTADANALGNPAKYTGNLSSGPPPQSSGIIDLLDLLSGQSNILSFSVLGSGQTEYRVQYNLVAACDQPYLSVEQGSIYSQGNIRAQYSPPQGSYNATYLILGGGTNAQPRVIENFVAGPPLGLTQINATFGQLVYPGTTSGSSPQISSFDYYGLTHNLAGSEVSGGPPARGDTNSYGHQVQVFSNSGGDVLLSDLVGSTPAPLAGKVYWVQDNLVVDQATQFANGSVVGTSGAGLIIVDGNLTINSDLTYQSGLGESVRNLASVGWLVMGNVTINPSVSQIVGAFFVAGAAGGGIFSTGAGPQQLTIFGAVIAKQLQLQRTASAGGGASERVVADGRVLLNTPPGFVDILSTLPTWQFRTP